MPIFSSAEAFRLGPPRPTTTAPPSTATHRPAARTSDVALIAIFDSPAQPGETIELAYRRKERALVEAFARLSIRESLELHRRLCDPPAGDHVAQRFACLVVQRRVRLLTFLIDARRRTVLAAARR